MDTAASSDYFYYNNKKYNTNKNKYKNYNYNICYQINRSDYHNETNRNNNQKNKIYYK